MIRRDFIALLGGAAAWPLAARAQPVPIVAFLSSLSAADPIQIVSTFRSSLEGAGYFDGKNVIMEVRYAEGDYARLPALAADLVALKPAAIVAAGPPAALALKGATSAVPVVFTVGFDPVAAGLVASMNRPGGNATGMSLITGPLGQKRFEALLELVPQAGVIGMLVNPQSPDTEPDIKAVESAARAYKKQIQVFRAHGEQEFDAAFAFFHEQGVAGLLIGSDPTFVDRRTDLVTRVAAQRIPAIYPFREFPAVGGLMSYGASLTSAYRQTADYVVRILKGAKPAELPVLQPATFELVINLKTAQALGLTVPPALQARADEVIE